MLFAILLSLINVILVALMSYGIFQIENDLIDIIILAIPNIIAISLLIASIKNRKSENKSTANKLIGAGIAVLIILGLLFVFFSTSSVTSSEITLIEEPQNDCCSEEEVNEQPIELEH